MGVRDVEGAVRVIERVDVGGREIEVRPLPGQFAGLLDDLRRGVDAGDVPTRDAVGQARGNRARTAADIEDPRVLGEMRQQVRRRVLRRPPAMRPQYRLVMSVRVNVCHAAILESVLNDDQVCLI